MVHLLAGQSRLENDYKDPDMLAMVNKAEMARMMEAIKEYLRSHHGVIRSPLAYIIRKTIIVQTYTDCQRYATPDNEMIIRMLQLSPDKNKLPLGHEANSVKEHTAEYKIKNRTAYKILDQIFDDTNQSKCQAA